MADEEKKNPEIEILEGKIEALVRKNRELLDEQKSKKSGSELHLAEALEKIELMQSQFDTAKIDYDKQLKKLGIERDTAIESAKSEGIANHKLLVDNGLTDALTKAGVRKEYLSAARALLKEQGIISVEAIGDIRTAVAKLEDGKQIALEEYITKHFAMSDTGKAFIPADQNNGAGALGSKSPPQATGLEARLAAAIAAGDADKALAIQSKMQENLSNRR